jgi:hypothetical protein
LEEAERSKKLHQIEIPGQRDISATLNVEKNIAFRDRERKSKEGPMTGRQGPNDHGHACMASAEHPAFGEERISSCRHGSRHGVYWVRCTEGHGARHPVLVEEAISLS